MEKETKSCLNCNKDDNRTGKPCPTRAGCFTPHYVNWETINQETEYASDYRIEAFTFANGELTVTVENDVIGVSELVEVTAADIIGLLKR